MSTYTQAHRRLSLETPFGKDVLLLRSFDGQEGMSQLFRFELDMLSTRDDLSAKDIVGKPVHFSIEYADGSPRHFHGFVCRFANCGKGDRLSMYKATVVPWLWFLTRTSDCRIFQNKSVPEIVKQVFGDLGFNQFSTAEIRGQHQPWEYCVQYRESDFQFVSRLMEHEGISYFFKHEQGQHTLVLLDQKGAYKDCAEAEVEMRGNLSAPELFDHLYEWEHVHEFRSGKWSQTDYNFETPSTSLMASAASSKTFSGSEKLEFYDFPGEYEKRSEGDDDIKLRIEQEEVLYDLARGASHCRSFSPGGKFKIKKHVNKSEEGKSFVLLTVRHLADAGATYVSNGDGGEVGSYRNTFTCIPDSVTYRPPRTTPKPKLHGAQTAVVVGPPGEEIYTDKYGRVKVQFHWDREGKKDDKSSCFIRTMQSAAGKGWGSMFVPRIGQEVVVTYLEGDLDRPLITGLVYNAEQMPAYPLPEHHSKSWIKTNSTKGGEGFNELRFEDKKDAEQIFMHAQRNFDLRVRNDAMERIGHDRHLIVGDDEGKTGDQLEQVFQDKHLNVKRDQIEHIEGNMELTVGQGDAANGGNLDLYVENNKTAYVGKTFDLQVGEEFTSKIDGGVSMTVGGDHHQKIGGSSAIETAQEIHIKAGMNVVIEAGVQLTLKGPGGFIDIGPTGVSIQGTVVLINSGGAPATGAGAKPKTPKKAKPAQPKVPTKADKSKTGHKSCK